MTVEEHIHFYARLRGVRNVDWETNELIRGLNLSNEKKKQAGTLSGGNKRKLSLAIAIVGAAPIVLLDEPSAAMDPQTRRSMWTVIKKITEVGDQLIILTTHSMEEA